MTFLLIISILLLLLVTRTPISIAPGMTALVFLLVVSLALLAAGQFMEPSSIVLILALLFLPIAKILGIDPIHLGIIMVVNMEIGMIHPPVGLNLFVASHLALLYLGLITYVPKISLWLPNLLYG